MRTLLDRRPAETIGRHALLDLTFEWRAGRTVLAAQYAEPPLRIGRVFDVAGAAYVILVCTGPGVFAGDRLHQRIVVGPRARVLLQSQSALQIHPAPLPRPAIVHHEYDVAAGAELYCHWDPIIPFAAARLEQRFDLRLHPEARLYWSDALMAGRVGRGERWAFETLRHELRLEVDGTLRYAERYCLAPSERLPPRRWIAGTADYVSTTIVRHDEASATVAEDLQRRCAGVSGVDAGIDLTDAGLIVGRLVATSGPSWSTCRARLRDRAMALAFASPHLAFRR